MSDIGTDLNKMIAAKDHRKVVNELMIGLISLDRKCPGVTDDRTARHGMRVLKTNDGRIVTRRNVDQSVSQSQSVPELTDKLGTENVGPVQSEILLFVVLIGTFAENNVV